MSELRFEVERGAGNYSTRSRQAIKGELRNGLLSTKEGMGERLKSGKKAVFFLCNLTIHKVIYRANFNRNVSDVL